MIVGGVVEAVEPEQLGLLALQFGIDVDGYTLVPCKMPVVEGKVYVACGDSLHLADYYFLVHVLVCYFLHRLYLPKNSGAYN